MLGSPIIETAIGITFIFLLLSLISSAVNESIASALRFRAKNLELGIKRLLSDDAGELTKEVMDHPLILSLTSGRGKNGTLPSYIPRETFSSVLTDVVNGAKSANKAPKPEELRAKIEGLGNEKLRESLLILFDNAERDVKKFRANVEQWFDNTMDRATGWYKRKTRLIIAICAFVIAFAANVDTIELTKTLYHNPTLRSSVATAATAFASDSATRAAVANARAGAASEQDTVTVAASVQQLNGLLAQLEETELPIGWESERLPSDVLGWLLKAVGLILTGLATALGAPFWFDVLNKISSLRGAGKQPAAPQVAPAPTAKA